MPPNTGESVLSNNLPIPRPISKSGSMYTLHSTEIILKGMLVVTLICSNRTGSGKHQHQRKMYRTNENRVDMHKGGRVEKTSRKRKLDFNAKGDETPLSEADRVELPEKEHSSHPGSQNSWIMGQTKSPPFPCWNKSKTWQAQTCLFGH